METNIVLAFIKAVKENKSASLAMFLFFISCFLPCMSLIFMIDRELFIELDIWKLLLLTLSISAASLLVCLPLGILLSVGLCKDKELLNPKVVFGVIITTEYLCAFFQLLYIVSLVLWDYDFLNIKIYGAVVYAICIVYAFNDHRKRKS